MKYCSNVAQSAKKCLRVLKMQNSAPNSKKCSKGAQRNRERPTWRTYLISFTVQYCFFISFCLYRACFTHGFLQIWVEIYVYGTMINWSSLNSTLWSSLIKKLMQTYLVKVSWSILYVSTVHLNVIWHLIWRYLSQRVLGGHPVLSGHYSIPRGCPLNTGITVFQT